MTSLVGGVECKLVREIVEVDDRDAPVAWCELECDDCGRRNEGSVVVA